MIVFGHYSIPLRTLTPQEIPSHLQVEANTTIQSVVRVAHIMWIPIFPFQKTWTIKKGADRFLINPQGVQMLNMHYGTPKTPWYAFALPILLVAGFALYNLNEYSTQLKYKKQYEVSMDKQNAEYLSWINSPATNDYYTFNFGSGQKCVLKVDSFTNDSIRFLSPEDPDGLAEWNQPGQRVGYFINPNSAIKMQTFAKSELQKLLQHDPNGQIYIKEGPVSAFFLGQKVKLELIERLDLDAVHVEYEDEITASKAVAAFRRFLSCRQNIDSSLLMIDTASTAYFSEMLRVAKTDDFVKMKTFIERSKYPLQTYQNMICTKFMYLNFKIKKNDNEAIKEYAFFLKLLEQGLWNFMDESKISSRMSIENVHFSSPQKAHIRVKALSNLITPQKTVDFVVNMIQEGGKWKVNVISTYSYSFNQLTTFGRITEDTKKEYRRKLIQELTNEKGQENSMVIGPEWKY